MPRGDKSSYTGKQQRQAEHIEEGYKEKGVSEDEAERRAWATVNKKTGGGKKKKASKKSSKRSKAKKSTARKTGGRKKSGRRKKAPKKKSS